MDVINVNYDEQYVGAVSFDQVTGVGAFEYSDTFIKSGIELSPLKMPLARKIYTFPQIDRNAFKGLPGLLADSLPDDFGNAVLNSWIATQGKSTDPITPLQRLQSTGKRGMGALEFSPATSMRQLNASSNIQIDSLVSIAQDVLDTRKDFAVALNNHGSDDKDAMLALLSVGMSAGGARPKAVVAFNNDKTEVRSGQTDAPEGFTHYLMKFDGVSEANSDRETFGDPMGFGAMEYVYYIMARKAGIDMMPCELLQEGDRRHFITQRFDRVGNDKIHVQTLNGMAHVSYKQPGQYSYAELFGVARSLRLGIKDAEQILKRLVFNIVARNHDDHSKNTSFIMKGDKWALAPAYDLAFSYKKGSPWVNSHWMTLNGKRDNFIREDLYSLGSLSPRFTQPFINKVIEEVKESVSQWRTLANDEGVPKTLITEIDENLRLYL